MTLLITGGGGFVMSNLARKWLEQLPDEHVIVLDSGPMDDALERYFEPVRDRLSYVRGSVLDAKLLDQIAQDHKITRIVHGATVTLFAPETSDGKPIKNPETDTPDKVLEVNFMGTVRMLELARRIDDLKCFINLSSGGVYNDDGPEPAGPMPEDGWVDPPEFYGISKYAGELVAKRYGKLFGINVASCRLSGVYGPMDRWRPSRAYHCPPYVVVHRALEGKTIRINAPEAVGDHLHAGDVAAGIIALMRKSDPFEYDTYNIALGQAVTLEELVEAVAQVVPGTSWEVRPEAECDVVMNPDDKHGRWGAYDISRIQKETGWQPRALRDALTDYVDFVKKFGVTP
ncbi:MAG: NAD(P)-dependent oxidoreductase [Paracoccaceae bacterium]